MKYFGTDGIRGIVNEKITPNLAYKVGLALANFFGANNTCVVGRDTRTSGSALSLALMSGLTAGGVNVTYVDIATSPCICYLTNNLSFNFGIIITASHNSPEFNGIKIFNSKGEKLTLDEEEIVEKLIDSEVELNTKKFGLFKTSKNLVNFYVDSLVEQFSSIKNCSLNLIIDCANGASSGIVKKLVKKLNLQAKIVNTQKNGENINVNAGALCANCLKQKISKKQFNVAFCFDGDADRVVVIDNKLNIRDGDDILYALSQMLHANKTIVATEYTNYGLEKSLKKFGINVLRAECSDFHVYQKLKQNNLILGGEKAGHIIFTPHAPCGDGVYAMLKLIEFALKINKPFAQIFSEFKKFPQIEFSISVTKQQKDRLFSDIKFKRFLYTCDELLVRDGRLLVRPSGTENVVRILVESSNLEKAKKIAALICDYIKTYCQLNSKSLNQISQT